MHADGSHSCACGCVLRGRGQGPAGTRGCSIVGKGLCVCLVLQVPEGSLTLSPPGETWAQARYL